MDIKLNANEQCENSFPGYSFDKESEACGGSKKNLIHEFTKVINTINIIDI